LLEEAYILLRCNRKCEHIAWNNSLTRIQLYVRVT